MKTYICDIDGTLADIGHRLRFIQSEPKDWDGFFEACAEDKPIKVVIDVIRAIGFVAWHTHNDDDYSKIIYLTGRPERVREKTHRWLAVNGLPDGELIMREDGDHRPDTIAKRELLEKIIADGGSVAAVFEDRPSVVRTWREMGLTVFQVGNSEEF